LEQLNSDRGEGQTKADIIFDQTARKKDQKRRETLLHDEATASSVAGRRNSRSVLLFILVNELHTQLKLNF